MPLITLTGFPSSGKTRRAAEIKSYFQQRINSEKEKNQDAATNASLPTEIHIIDDPSLGVAKTAYAIVSEEKKARGAVLAAVERYLSKDSLVIVDSMNYIKGLRYQIYCTARMIKSPFCTVHCAVPKNVAREWNDSRGDEGYDQTTFDELVMRYEEPDGRTRWDSPLFTIQHDDKELPLDLIWDAMIVSKAKPSLRSTTRTVVKETNYLYELEAKTQAIMDAILAAQKDNTIGIIKVPGAEQKICLPSRTLTLSELRRLRRQFTQLNRQHTVSEDRIADNFVQYLSTVI